MLPFYSNIHHLLITVETRLSGPRLYSLSICTYFLFLISFFYFSPFSYPDFRSSALFTRTISPVYRVSSVMGFILYYICNNSTSNSNSVYRIFKYKMTIHIYTYFIYMYTYLYLMEYVIFSMIT